MTTLVRISRRLPHSPDAALAWLTDYDEGDPDRAGKVLIAKRRIVSREGDKVRMTGEHRAFGRLIPSVYEVEVDRAARSWVSRVVEGPRAGSVTAYRLTEVEDGSRLDVEYRMEVADATGRALLALAKPLVKRSLSKMWARYAAAMDAELRSSRSSSPTP